MKLMDCRTIFHGHSACQDGKGAMRFDTHEPIVILEPHKASAPNRCNPLSVMNKVAQVTLVFWVMKI